MTNYNPFSLSNKTILITGASSGIGKAIAIECSKLGAKLIITGRNEFRLNETFELLEKECKHTQIVGDLTHSEFTTNLVENIAKLDGVVHCAGVASPLPFQFVNSQSLQDILSVNFAAPTLISALLTKKRKINRNASIVFISSISGVNCSYLGGSLYSASKGALNGLIKGMALDLAVKGIRVNSVNPGMIETAILESGVISQEQLEEDKKHYPLKRYGKPTEVAHAVIYLLSDAASWVTGTNLLIDGGYTLQ